MARHFVRLAVYLTVLLCVSMGQVTFSTSTDWTARYAAPVGVGKVCAMNTAGLLEVSLGVDDGAFPGSQLDLLQNDRLVARVGVQNASSDRAIARVVELREPVMIQRGDQIVLWEIRTDLRPAEPVPTNPQVIAVLRALETHAQLAADVDVPPPPLYGSVIAVNDRQMMELSLGSDDGLRPGHIVHIYRSTNYLGTAEILSTTTDRAIAKQMPGRPRGVVLKGDIFTLQKLPARVDL